jgi:anti-anti-sigma factor
MNGLLCNTADTLLIAPGNLHELVRGQERELVERLTPIVQKQNVTLDLAQVERIDAAGIAALISLYGCAFNTGNEFNVVNATPHVAEILALVGLDRILLTQNAVTASQTGSCLVQSAA